MEPWFALDARLLLLPSSSATEEDEEADVVTTGLKHRTRRWPLEALPCRWAVYESDAEAASLVADAATRGLEVVFTTKAEALKVLGLASEFDSRDYLSSKGQLDRISRSKTVAREAAAKLGTKVRVLDLGAGSLELVDHVKLMIKVAKTKLERYLAVDFEFSGTNSTVECFRGDANDVEGQFDLVAGNSFADLMEPTKLAALLTKVTAPGGLVYLPITFAGSTSLEPSRTKDEMIFSAYHDRLRESGQFFDIDNLKAALSENFRLIAEDDSDWLIPLGTRFATFMSHFLSSTLVPYFLSAANDMHDEEDLSPRDGLTWIADFRREAADDSFAKLPRSLLVRNVDLLFQKIDS